MLARGSFHNNDDDRTIDDGTIYLESHRDDCDETSSHYEIDEEAARSWSTPNSERQSFFGGSPRSKGSFSKSIPASRSSPLRFLPIKSGDSVDNDSVDSDNDDDNNKSKPPPMRFLPVSQPPMRFKPGTNNNDEGTTNTYQDVPEENSNNNNNNNNDGRQQSLGNSERTRNVMFDPLFEKTTQERLEKTSHTSGSEEEDDDNASASSSSNSDSDSCGAINGEGIRRETSFQDEISFQSEKSGSWHNRMLRDWMKLQRGVSDTFDPLGGGTTPQRSNRKVSGGSTGSSSGSATSRPPMPLPRRPRPTLIRQLSRDISIGSARDFANSILSRTREATSKRNIDEFETISLEKSTRQFSLRNTMDRAKSSRDVEQNLAAMKTELSESYENPHRRRPWLGKTNKEFSLRTMLDRARYKPSRTLEAMKTVSESGDDDNILDHRRKLFGSSKCLTISLLVMVLLALGLIVFQVFTNQEQQQQPPKTPIIVATSTTTTAAPTVVPTSRATTAAPTDKAQTATTEAAPPTPTTEPPAEEAPTVTSLFGNLHVPPPPAATTPESAATTTTTTAEELSAESYEDFLDDLVPDDRYWDIAEFLVNHGLASREDVLSMDNNIYDAVGFLAGDDPELLRLEVGSSSGSSSTAQEQRYDIVQRYALLMLRYAVGGDWHWHIENQKHECDWQITNGDGSFRSGVVCDEHRRVREIYLPNNSEYWSRLPSEIQLLTGLRTLDLKGNSLAGTVPEWLFSGFEELEYLDLSHNDLTGTLPSEFDSNAGIDTNLKALFLHYNQLTGTIPRAIAEMPNLVTVTIHNNDNGVGGMRVGTDAANILCARNNNHNNKIEGAEASTAFHETVSTTLGDPTCSCCVEVPFDY